LLELAAARGWTVISDEAYEDFVYEGRHVSIAALERGLPERDRRVVTVFSFSKSHGMTGLRLGYVVAPHDRTARLLRIIQEASLVAPCTPVQYGGIVALALTDEVRRRRSAMLGVRNHALTPFLCDGALPRLPPGGWYALLNVLGSRLTGEQFATMLLRERRVAVTPAAGFSYHQRTINPWTAASAQETPESRHLVRVAFCGDSQLVEEGVARFRRSLSS